MTSLQKLPHRELLHSEMDVALVADIAIPVGMALHELASNSDKFGRSRFRKFGSKCIGS
jgi:two-component sensor histidine kinase